jgi:hypothetical protein
MPRGRPKLPIADHIRVIERLQEESAETQVEAAMKNPAVTAQRLDELLREWRQKGPDTFLLNDPEYVKFRNDISRQLMAEFFVAIKLANKLLVEKLQTGGEFVLPKELSAIIRDLGSEIKHLNDTITQPPGEMIGKSSVELDAKIAQLEKELLTADGKLLDS